MAVFLKEWLGITLAIGPSAARPGSAANYRHVSTPAKDIGQGRRAVIAFGTAPWLDFPAQLDRITDIFRGERTNMKMLVSIYGLGRTLGLSHTVALVPQAAVSLAAAVVVCKLWRGDAMFALKAAGLIIASLIASPYLYVYDLTVLVAALAFLFQASGRDGFDDTELMAIAAMGVVTFAYSVTPFPAGVAANAIVAALVYRRCTMAGSPQIREASAAPSAA